MGRGDAEQLLSSLSLRFIAKFPFSASGVGLASAQQPAAGTSIPEFSVVTVEYPSPLGPLDDSPVSGPEPTSGLLEGAITSVFVGQEGAGIGFSLSNGVAPFRFGLYKDSDPVGREGWMRRGAMLALAQRAFSGKDRVRISFGNNMVETIVIFR